jgi:hypothetical protein
MKKRVKEKRDLLVIRNPVSFREGATEQGDQINETSTLDW